jgi:hypothetical protein
MRKVVLFLLGLLAALDIGIYVAGPPIVGNTVAIGYHPEWVPAVFAPMIPGEPTTSPIHLPPGSYSGLGVVPGLSLPEVQDLWVGIHTYILSVGAARAERWASRRVGKGWQSALQGRSFGPHQKTIYEWGFRSRKLPHQMLYLNLQALSAHRTMVTIEVQSIQIPNRPSSSYLPLGARSVRIVYQTYRPSRKAVVVVRPATVSGLLSAVNGGHVVPLGVGDCGAADTWNATLDFRYAGGVTRKVGYAPSCGWVVVGKDRSTPFTAESLYSLVRRIAHDSGIRLP